MILQNAKKWYHAFLIFLKWLLLAVLTGLVAGGVGVVFHSLLEWCGEFRESHPAVLWGLPFAGVLIAWLYHVIGKDRDRGTNMVITAVRSNEPVPPATGPLIFVSTALTHLFGGSAGREGAALQLGGCIASVGGGLLKLDEKDQRVLVMCGMSAAFAALFGTPAAAAFFSLEMVSVGVMYYAAIVPCTIAALTGYLLAGVLGVEPTALPYAGAPEISLVTMLQVGVLGLLCGLLSILFCSTMHHTAGWMKRFFPNTMVRAAAGGCMIILLTLLCGTRDYNGAGMNVIIQAASGTVVPWAFLLKLIFTAITLSSGFKGGEIVPTFFVGATFGCAVAPLLGLDPAFGAAIGLTALFCGVTNCPVTSLLLGLELFAGSVSYVGNSSFLFFLLACAISYMLSGNFSLYGEQIIVYSKLKAEYINVKAD